MRPAWAFSCGCKSRRELTTVERSEAQLHEGVRVNKGAAGVDGLDINQTSRHLATAWPGIKFGNYVGNQLLKSKNNYT